MIRVKFLGRRVTSREENRESGEKKRGEERRRRVDRRFVEGFRQVRSCDRMGLEGERESSAPGG